MDLGRRSFLAQGCAAATGVLAARAFPFASVQPSKPDYTLRIAAGLIEVAPNRFVSTTLYNGQFPGPLMRFREGQAVTVEIVNDTDVPEQVHWHGQLVPVDVDGSAEEGTPFIPPHGRRTIRFVPGPAGLRLYHTHTHAGLDLHRGQYTGLVGPVFIEPRSHPGAYDQEVFLMLKEFEPSLSAGGDDEPDFLSGDELDALRRIAEAGAEPLAGGRTVKPLEVQYQVFTINGRQLGGGEPLRVKQGERVMLHVINGSATETRSLALPGHTFDVVALDGNPVSTPTAVNVLWIAPGERISALISMHQVGVWIMGDIGEARFSGMGLVVEYAGARGEPEWIEPVASSWNYATFGAPAGRKVPTPDAVLEVTITERRSAPGAFSRWHLNGVAFSMDDMTPMFRLQHGARYRLRVRNATDDLHPLHLHRHIFEVTRVGGQAASGVMKDVVMLGRLQEVELDFTAGSRGKSLFHCHMQSHMDNGFMALFDCA